MKVTFSIELGQEEGGYYTFQTTRERNGFPAFVPGMEVDFAQISSPLLVKRVVWSETHRALFVYLEPDESSDKVKTLETILNYARKNLIWELVSFDRSH